MAVSQDLVLRALDVVTRPPRAQLESLSTVRAAHFRKFSNVMEDDNIVAVGVSEKQVKAETVGELTVCFYVKKKLPLSQMKGSKMVPAVISMPGDKAVFTDVKELGELVPQIQQKKRPLESGFSIGHPQITAGTLGAIVRKGGKLYVLSNSHVLANSGKGRMGDPVFYPGVVDGGQFPGDVVARLSDFVQFDTSGKLVNHVDAALAEINEELYDHLKLAIYKAQSPHSMIVAKRGMRIAKSGRTTGKTTGKVIDVNFRFVLKYPGVGGKVGFIDQVLCTRYSDGGDSGSVVVDTATGKIVGLHFAGASGGSVFSPIAKVKSALKFQFA